MAVLRNLLFNARTKLKMSLREAEKISGVSNAYISLIESGKRTDPHPNILRKLADCYGLDIDEVMKSAGYLDAEPHDEKKEIENLYRQAISDSAFAFGRRSKEKVDFQTKKLIAEMYRELKEKRSRN